MGINLCQLVINSLKWDCQSNTVLTWTLRQTLWQSGSGRRSSCLRCKHARGFFLLLFGKHQQLLARKRKEITKSLLACSLSWCHLAAQLVLGAHTVMHTHSYQSPNFCYGWKNLISYCWLESSPSHPYYSCFLSPAGKAAPPPSSGVPDVQTPREIYQGALKAGLLLKGRWGRSHDWALPARVPEKGKQDRLWDAGQVQPRVQIKRQYHSDEANQRSSQEVNL